MAARAFLFPASRTSRLRRCGRLAHIVRLGRRPRAQLLDAFLDALGQLALVLEVAQGVLRLLHHELHPRQPLRDVVDDRLLLAERLEIDADVLEEVRDEAGLRLDLVDGLPPRVDRVDLVLGLGRGGEQVLHLAAQRRDLLAVVADVLQVGAAARADLVDVLDLRLDRVDERLALDNRLYLVVDLVGLLRQLGHLRFDRADLLLGERQVRPALVERLVHRVGALDLVLGGFGLRDRVTLARLDARELGDELVLDGGRAIQLVAERLHLLHAFGRFAGQRAAGFGELRNPHLLLVDRRLVTDDFLEPRLRLVELRLQDVEPVRQRHDLALGRGDLVDLLLRVEHLRDDAVALRLERVELRAARELLGELAIDVRGHDVQRVDARLELVHELDAAREARQLRVELRGDLSEPRRLLRAFVHVSQLSEDRVHRRLELRRARAQRGEAVAQTLQRRAIGTQHVAELRRLRVRLVEILDVLPERLEGGPVLLETVVLRGGALRQLVDLREPLLGRLEGLLLPGQLVGVPGQRLEFLAERVGLLIEQREVLFLRAEGVDAVLRFAHRRLQGAQPLVERLELLLLERELLEVRAQHVHEGAAVLLEPGRLAPELVADLRRGVDLRVGLGHELLDSLERFLAARRLLQPFVQLPNLDVHAPDQLVEAVGLDDRALDGVLLRL